MERTREDKAALEQKKGESALEREIGETAQVRESKRLPWRKILPCLLACRAVQGNVWFFFLPGLYAQLKPIDHCSQPSLRKKEQASLHSSAHHLWCATVPCLFTAIVTALL